MFIMLIELVNYIEIQKYYIIIIMLSNTNIFKFIKIQTF